MNKKEQELIREINKLLDTNKEDKKFSVLDITLLLIHSNVLTEEHFETLGRDTINDIIKTQLDKYNSLKEFYSTDNNIYYRGYDSRYNILDSNTDDGHLYTWVTDSLDYALSYAENYGKYGKVAKIKLSCSDEDIGGVYDLSEDTDYWAPGDDDFQEYILDAGLKGYGFEAGDDEDFCLCVSKNCVKILDQDIEVIKEGITNDNSFITVYTYQTFDVVQLLKNGITYTASCNEPSHKKEYKALEQLLGLHNCPIFGALTEEDVEEMISSSGINTSNIIKLKLEIPYNKIHLMEYYDWTDYMYALDYPEDFYEESGMSVQELGEKIKTQRSYSDYTLCQVVFDEIKPEWYINSPTFLEESEEGTSEEDVEMEVVDIDIDKYIPRIYSILVGILLTTEEANRNGENYNTFNQNQYGFEPYYEGDGLDISKEHAIKEAISYCRSGVPYTYGIVFEFYQEDTFLTSSEFTDAIYHIQKGDFYDYYYSMSDVLDLFENKNRIIYSVYKDANGNLIEDFLDKPIPGFGNNQQ